MIHSRAAGGSLIVQNTKAVVNRLLRDRTDSGTETTRNPIPVKPAGEQPQFAEEIDFNEAIEALGEDGINAIADAMEMFRSM